MIKRLRIFAGPNGSGKTTLKKMAQEQIPIGIYVNADEIEKTLQFSNQLFFDFFGLNVSQNSLQTFFKKSVFSPIKLNKKELWKKIKVKKNILQIGFQVDSYFVADLADFIRNELLKNDKSFSFETVMSHKGKIDFIQKARKAGYRIYLYYISTENPDINIDRVRVRVSQNGHFVNNELILKRYEKSLQLLKKAVKLSDRAYIFDNSDYYINLCVEVTNGTEINQINKKNIPKWVNKYLF